MMATMQEIVGRLCDAYHHGSSLVLLFDYDGTLTPIVEHPDLAILDRKTERLLADLAGRPRVHVGILSGRELDELKSLIDVPRLYLAGTGGMELEMRGYRFVHPHADRIADMIDRLADLLDSHVAEHQGAWLEMKRLGLTVHYRQMPEELVGSLQAAVQEVTQCFAGELKIVQGPKAWEITAAKGWNKGTAVRLILADCGATSDVLFYAGDGCNDAEAIEEVAAMGGITLGIGSNAPPAAEYRLANHTALREFLGRLDASFETRKRHVARSSKYYLGLYGYWKSTLPTNPM